MKWDMVTGDRSQRRDIKIEYEVILDREIFILVAEKDRDFLKMVEDSLKLSGGSYRIKKVSSGEECLKLLQKEEFDILLLDHARRE